MITESIFGMMSPKIVFNFGGINETTVLLNYWVTTKDEAENEKEIIQDSELEADRTIIPVASYWAFEGYIYLLRYKTLIERRSKFEEVYQFNKKQVTLWKHNDGMQFKDKNGNNVPFYMQVIPKNLTTLDFQDLLIVKFRSLSEVYFSHGSEIITVTPEIDMDDSIKID